MSQSLQAAIRPLSHDIGQWKAICEQWVLELVDHQEDETQCVCGVTINYRYHILNLQNNNTAVVGSECIKQFLNSKLIADAKQAKDVVMMPILIAKMRADGHVFALTFDHVDSYGKAKFSSRVNTKLHRMLERIDAGGSKLWLNKTGSSRQIWINAKIAPGVQCPATGSRCRVNLRLRNWTYQGRSGTLLEVMAFA